MLTKSRWKKNIVSFSTLALLMASCLGGGGGSGGSENSRERIRFINGDPNSKSLVFELVYAPPASNSSGSNSTTTNTTSSNTESDLLNAEVLFSESSPFLDAPEGNLKIRVREPKSILPAIDSALKINSNEIYTVSVTRENDDLVITTNKESFDLRPPQSSNVNLRAINLSEDNPSIDIYLLDTSFKDQISTAIKDATPAVSALAFKAFGSYVAFKPTDLILVSTLAGSKTKILSKKQLSFGSVDRFSTVFFSLPKGVNSSESIITDTYQDSE